MNRPAILIFDESAAQRERVGRWLGRLDADISAASSLARAVRRLAEDGETAVFVAGFRALGPAERDVLARLKKGGDDLRVIVLTPPPSNPGPVVELLDQGWVDHVASPDDESGLYAAVRSALRLNDLQKKNALAVRSLRKLKAEQARYLAKASELEDIYDTTIENLMTALDLRDVETLGHSQTVAKYCQALARLLGIEDPVFLENIRRGALLHDIGKIAIPDGILKKPGALTAEEWAKIRLHPSLGYGLVKEIKIVKEIGNVILYHHERYDGTGYPSGLKKERIPIEARIFALADALDAITAPRPYRAPSNFLAARKEIIRHSGTQFDPKAVEAFASLAPEKWERIRLETTSYIPNIEEFSKFLRAIKSR
jgi:putative nucleotidyltransferase with HDIG domain